MYVIGNGVNEMNNSRGNLPPKTIPGGIGTLARSILQRPSLDKDLAYRRTVNFRFFGRIMVGSKNGRDTESDAASG